MPFLQPDTHTGPRGELGGSVLHGGVARRDYVTAQYHSNMGNTGSFMLRQAQWKYIAFGQNGHRFNGSCGADCTYAIKKRRKGGRHHQPHAFDNFPDYASLPSYPHASPITWECVLRAERPRNRIDRRRS